MDEGTDEGENGALLSLTSLSKRGLTNTRYYRF